MPILAFLGRRLAIFAISLVGASLLVFAVCSALPGEVAEVILGEGATQAQIDALTAELRLDRPWPVRYAEWVGGMLHGDFGASYFTGQSVSSLMAPRIAVTLWLVLFALLVSIAVAIPVGMVAAMKRRSWQGFAATAAAQLGMAVPAFWAAIVLVLVFAVGLRWLPANGYVPLTTDPASWAAHLVLPVISLPSCSRRCSSATCARLSSRCSARTTTAPPGPSAGVRSRRCCGTACGTRPCRW